MAWWVIALIVIGAVVLVALLVLAGRRGRERQLESKRSEATELRQEAGVRARRAEERAALAEEQAERARQERAAADATARRADEVDPDIES